jgi:hypothetical protein
MIRQKYPALLKIQKGGNNMNIFFDSMTSIINSVIYIISSYIPKLIAGILIILIGMIVASLFKDFIKIVFKYFHLEKWLKTAGLARDEEVTIWPNIISELVRWIIIFIFLMSAVDVWGVPKVADVLNQLLSFLPSVFLAVIIGWVGIVAGRIAFNIVRHGLNGVGKKESVVLGNVAKYSILFFTVLIILNQLGVAADLVRILFTGIIGMLALSFGLAFGLGGKDEAKEILRGLRDKVNKIEQKAKK